MSRHPHTTTSTAAAALVAAALTGCLADDGLAPPTPDEPGTSVAALANDTNAKLFLTTAAAAGTAPPTIDLVGSYQNWAKDYHRVVKLAGNRLGFYRRTSGALRIIEVASDGSFQTVSTTTLIDGADEVLVGEFGGTASRRDLLFFNRAASLAWSYEVAADGTLQYLGFTQLAETANGGTWDLAASGFLGQAGGKDDLLVYNKTEGAAAVYRVTNSAPLSWSLSKQKSFTGMKRSWDAIVPANLDGDGFTDFAFYNQDGGGVIGTQDLVGWGNPMNGHVKFESLGPSLTWTKLGESFDTWPMAAHVVVVPGNFGGSALTDFLVYDGDPDGTTTATYWINNGDGTFARQTPITSWQGRWTSIVPLELAGGATDLFFYTRQIEAKLLLVIDNDAGGSAGVTDSAATLVADFTAWMRSVNRTYAPAGIHFTVNPTTRTFDMDNVNGSNLVGGTSSCYATGDAARAALNTLAGSFRASFPGHIVVYVRSRGKGSLGCSSDTADFAVMPPPSQSDTTGNNRTGVAVALATNPKLFAHELGHFFALDHSQPSDFIAAPADRYAYDTDRGNVSDTPPNPSRKATTGVSPWDAVANVCDDSGANDLAISGAGFAYTLNPERHEIMEKGINCDNVYRMTPDQVRVAHENLWTRAWPIQ